MYAGHDSNDFLCRRNTFLLSEELPKNRYHMLLLNGSKKNTLFLKALYCLEIPGILLQNNLH
jgi:hypothetical protein